ncbi:MAG: hypothetical protein ACJ72W_05270 [Actinoallomurus sp.]
MPYLLRAMRPRIVRDLGETVAAQIFVDNPARAFAAEWRDESVESAGAG